MDGQMDAGRWIGWWPPGEMASWVGNRDGEKGGFLQQIPTNKHIESDGKSSPYNHPGKKLFGKNHPLTVHLKGV